MPRATVVFGGGLHYRRDAFEHGLKRLGYEIAPKPLLYPEPGDVLVIWNRKPSDEGFARTYEKAGAEVIVAENGYVGRAPDGDKLYALALGHHNGIGAWPSGGPERWERLGVDLAPWRSIGRDVVILPQRGIGERGVAMPLTWTAQMYDGLKARTSRPISIRRHPGVAKLEPYEALMTAHAAVTWASGAAIKAIVAGVPVFYGLEGWIGAAAASRDINRLETPPLPDRLPMLHRLAWAQWSILEIHSGEAFAWLLTSQSGSSPATYAQPPSAPPCSKGSAAAA